MRKSGWAVAAAIMVFENAAMHYKTLGSLVWQSGLSGLRSRGGRTIDQTLGQEMRSRPDVIYSRGDGFYQTNGDAEAMANSEVRECAYVLMNEKLKRHDFLVRSILASRSPSDADMKELGKLQEQIRRVTDLCKEPEAAAVASS